MFDSSENNFKIFGNFVCEKIFEMLPMQKFLRYLPQRDQKRLAEYRLYFSSLIIMIIIFWVFLQ